MIRGNLNLKEDADLPWVAMTYETAGKNYTVQYMNHPANPKGALFSAYRDYGRFGSFFVKKIKHNAELNLNYRIRITKGEAPARADLEKQFQKWIGK